MKRQTKMIRALSLAVVAAVLMLFASDAMAATRAGSTQEKWLGQPKCGGAYPDGRLAPPCEVQRAAKIGKARGECPRGTFFDVGTWSCYTCPSGYNRTANSVTEWDACSKKVPTQRSKAAYVSKSQCKSGEVNDPRNGGECWTCPSGYGRTGSAVDAWDACGMILKKAVAAEFQRKACTDGFFDPRNGGECWRCPQDFRRTWSAVDATDACIQEEVLKPAQKEAALSCEAGDHFDIIDGGSCWRCPAGYDRSWSAIDAKDACVSARVQWQGSTRDPNSLYMIPGGPEIAADVIAERTLIDEAADVLIKSNRAKDPVAFKAAVWKGIEGAPSASPVLKAAVFRHVINLVKAPGQKKPYENEFQEYFAVYIQDSRALVAKQGQDAYFSWKRFASASPCERAGNKDCPTGMSVLFSSAGKPPEMSEVVGPVLITSAVGTATAGTIFAVFTSSTPALLTALTNITPHAVALVEALAVQASNGLAGSAAALGGATATSLSAAAGPLVIVTGAAVLMAAGLDIVISQLAEEGKLDAAIREAQRPVVLEVLTRNDNGMMELAQNWALMTQESFVPKTVNLRPSTTENTPKADDSMVFNGKPVEALAARPRKLRAVGTDFCLNPVGNAMGGQMTIVPCTDAQPFGVQRVGDKSPAWKLAAMGGKMVVLGDGRLVPIAQSARGADIVVSTPPASKPQGNQIVINATVGGRATFQLKAEQGCLIVSVAQPGTPIVAGACDAGRNAYWEVVF